MNIGVVSAVPPVLVGVAVGLVALVRSSSRWASERSLPRQPEREPPDRIVGTWAGRRRCSSSMRRTPTDGLADMAARLTASAGPTGGLGPGGGAGGWLLLAGFCLLWTEAFLFRR